MVPDKTRRGPWSQSEDRQLLRLVEMNGPHNWVRISSAMDTRTPKQCRERYHQNLKRGLNHEPITPEEGRLIEQLVAEMGKKWAEIARRLKGRSDNAVKNWWNGNVNRRNRARGRASERSPRVAQRRLPAFLSEAAMTSFHELYQPHGASASQSHPFYPRTLQPLNLPGPSRPEYGQHLPHHVDTPLPSPVGTVASADGTPSLISDTSSARSPYPTNHSPVFGISLPPLIGTRDERRNSVPTTLRLGQPGFPTEEDDRHAGQVRRPSFEEPKPTPYFNTMLPPMSAPQPSQLREPAYQQEPPQPPVFREPSFQQAPPRSAPLLTQPYFHEAPRPDPAWQPSQVRLPNYRELEAAAAPEPRYPPPPPGNSSPPCYSFPNPARPQHDDSPQREERAYQYPSPPRTQYSDVRHGEEQRSPTPSPTRDARMNISQMVN